MPQQRPLSGVINASIRRGGTPTQYLADLFPWVNCGGSYHRLASPASYSGPCLKVERDSGGTLDIGYSGDYLDTAELLSYCAGTIGRLHTLYDPLGAVPLTAASSGQQPIICRNGLVETHNGLEGAYSDGSIDQIGVRRPFTFSALASAGSSTGALVVQSHPVDPGNTNIHGTWFGKPAFKGGQFKCLWTDNGNLTRSTATDTVNVSAPWMTLVNRGANNNVELWTDGSRNTQKAATVDEIDAKSDYGPWSLPLGKVGHFSGSFLWADAVVPYSEIEALYAYVNTLYFG